MDDDWADGSLFDRVQELTNKYNTKGKFTFSIRKDRIFLGYATPGELERIRNATGLDIVWLKAKGHIYQP